MRPIKGIAVLLSLAALSLTGCATHHDEPVNLGKLPQEGGLPMGAKPGPVKGTLTAEETKQQFKSLKMSDYTVKKGDTLWSIANHFLKDPYYWPEIWYDNPQIKNPHRIYPGDKIGIMYIGGRPRLGVTMRPHIRYESLPPAISAIPLDMLKPYLSYDQVLSAQQLADAPYILDNQNDVVSISRGDVAYVRPELSDKHDVWAVVGKGKPLIDPVTGAHYGYRAIFEGEAKVTQRGDPTVVRISKSKREIHNGDRLVPMASEPFDKDVEPRIPAFPIAARIILLPDAITQIGNNQVVILNVGQDQGVVPGDLLRVSNPGRIVEDRYTHNPSELKKAGKDEGLTPDKPRVKLPSYPIGVAMVFRTYDHVSYALVVKATRPIHVGDMARTPTDD